MTLLSRAGRFWLLVVMVLVSMVYLSGVAVAGPADAQGEPGPASTPLSGVTLADAEDGARASAAASLDLAASLNPNPPATTVRLVFVHHSTGEGLLNDALRAKLNGTRYFVVDTNYGWGPADADVGSGTIGDHTDIGHWYNWFVGPHRTTYTNALYTTNNNAALNRGLTNPGGTNAIVTFKSCFPNSALGGNPYDPPTVGPNPLRGKNCGSQYHTVANAKGIYRDLLTYFASKQNKLFVVITAPPLVRGATTSRQAANARAFNRWLVNNWLSNYPYKNVAVFDFYDVLTSNGGSPTVNDLGWATGNHHRYRSGAVQYVTNQGSNYSAYGQGGDSHPTAAGNRKAAGELVPLLNVAFRCWRGTCGCLP